MNNIEVISNELFGKVKTISNDTGIYFCANDIATMLGYKDSNKAVRTHCSDYGKIDVELETNGGLQKIKFINEPNVYRLVMKSKLDTAQNFEKWVFEEVLPSLRNNGAYITDAKAAEIESGSTTADEVFKEVQEYKVRLRDMQGKLESAERKVTLRNILIDNYSNLLPLYSISDMVEVLNNELDSSIIDEDIIKLTLSYKGYIEIKNNGKYVLTNVIKCGKFAEVKSQKIIDNSRIEGYRNTNVAYFNEAIKNDIRNFIKEIIDYTDELAKYNSNAPKFMQVFYNTIREND